MITLDRELLNLANRLPPVLNRSRPPRDRDGFTFIGSGGDRVVWLGPDENVYKLPKWDREYNSHECLMSRSLRSRNDLPNWIYIPEMVYDLETGIAVAEYIVGTQMWECYYSDCVCTSDVCRWERAEEAFELIGVVDSHAGNCVIVECSSESDFIVAIVDFTH
jgi:hypothetical protein